MSDYPAFGKIPRLHREVVLTEKIDGTNGLISIQAVDGDLPPFEEGTTYTIAGTHGAFVVRAGSRNRWLSPTKSQDNHGFAAWVADNAGSLAIDLGPGLHYGEWWGKGIGKRYSDVVAGKYFSLFNVSRWEGQIFDTPHLRVVPVLDRVPAQELNLAVKVALANLRAVGSKAAKGCMKPEGIIVFHTASNGLFKVTLEKDEEYKGKERTT